MWRFFDFFTITTVQRVNIWIWLQQKDLVAKTYSRLKSAAFYVLSLRIIFQLPGTGLGGAGSGFRSGTAEGIQAFPPRYYKRKSEVCRTSGWALRWKGVTTVGVCICDKVGPYRHNICGRKIIIIIIPPGATAEIRLSTASYLLNRCITSAKNSGNRRNNSYYQQSRRLYHLVVLLWEEILTPSCLSSRLYCLWKSMECGSSSGDISVAYLSGWR